MSATIAILFLALHDPLLWSGPPVSTAPQQAAREVETGKEALGAGAGDALETDIGEATYYGRRFHGRLTASGERFDQNALTAAHRTYPFGTIVRVTNLDNGRSIVLRINDRGPFGPAKKAARKIIDVSRAAAAELGFVRKGRTVVRLEVLEWGSGGEPTQEPM